MAGVSFSKFDFCPSVCLYNSFPVFLVTFHNLKMNDFTFSEALLNPFNQTGHEASLIIKEDTIYSNEMAYIHVIIIHIFGEGNSKNRVYPL